MDCKRHHSYHMLWKCFFVVILVCQSSYIFSIEEERNKNKPIKLTTVGDDPKSYICFLISFYFIYLYIGRAGFPAELVSVSWFELSGSVPVIPGKRYRISFKLGFNPNSFGWNAHPIFLMAKIGKSGRYVWKGLTELERMPRGPIDIPADGNSFEIEVPPSALDTMLYFGIYEIWSGSRKKGLLVYSASVKEVKTDDQAQ